jgi:hypothetical protein
MLSMQPDVSLKGKEAHTLGRCTLLRMIRVWMDTIALDDDDAPLWRGYGPFPMMTSFLELGMLHILRVTSCLRVI